MIEHVLARRLTCQEPLQKFLAIEMEAQKTVLRLLPASINFGEIRHSANPVELSVLYVVFSKVERAKAELAHFEEA